MGTKEEYVKAEIEGTYDLPTIQATIRGKEAKYFEFKDNEIVESLTNPGKKTNILTFKKLTLQIPDDLILLESGVPKPDGKKQVWPEAGKTGKMMVKGAETEVIAYR